MQHYKEIHYLMDNILYKLDTKFIELLKILDLYKLRYYICFLVCHPKLII
jgi:hypothetical protein